MTEINGPVVAGLSFVAFLAGFIDSIAGGGGLLQLPALLLAGIPPQTAMGTNKFASTMGTGVALLNFIHNRKIIWKIAAVGIAFTLGGAYLGTRAILLISNQLVGKLIVVLLPFAMMATLIPRQVEPRIDSETGQQQLWLIPVICFSLGFYDGFFGPGTGSFLILAFYFWLHLDLVMASGTAKVFNLGSNLGSLGVFLWEGKVLYAFAIPMAIANIAGNYLGSSLAIRKGAGVVRAFLVVALVILLVSLGWKYFVQS